MVRIADDTPFGRSPSRTGGTGVTSPPAPVFPTPSDNTGSPPIPSPPHGPASPPAPVFPTPSDNTGSPPIPSGPFTSITTVPYSPPPNQFGITATGVTSSLIPTEIDTWPSAQELDLFFPGLGLFRDDDREGQYDFYTDGSVWDELDVARRRNFLEQAIASEVRPLVLPKYEDLFDRDPIAGLGLSLYEQFDEEINKLLRNPKWLSGVLGIDEEQLQLIPQEKIELAIRMAIEDIKGANTPEQMAIQLMNTLRIQWDNIYQLIQEADPNLLEQERIKSLHEKVQQRIKEIDGTLDAIDKRMNKETSGLPYKNVEAFMKINQMTDRELAEYRNALVEEKLHYIAESQLDPMSLRALGDALMKRKLANSAASEIVQRLIDDPDLYRQLREENEKAREEFWNEEFGRAKEVGEDIFGLKSGAVATAKIGKSKVFEDDLERLLSDSNSRAAIEQNPADFLATHFRFLTPETFEKYFNSSVVSEYLQQYTGSSMGRFVSGINIENNPLYVDSPFFSPLQNLGKAIGNGLEFFGVPEEIAEPAGMLAAYTPVMVGSIASTATGAGAPFGIGMAYLAIMDTLPRIANDPISRESLVALADFGVSLALFSPATNAIEDAVTASIVRSLPGFLGNSRVIQTGVAIAARSGINILEDVPTTAAVLAIAGVDPESEEFKQIIKETVIFDAALGIAMPLSSTYLTRGLPEIGAFAITYVGMRHGLGADEEEARNAALSMAFSVALARHSALAHAIDAGASIGRIIADSGSVLRSMPIIGSIATRIDNIAAILEEKAEGFVENVKTKITEIIAPHVVAHADSERILGRTLARFTDENGNIKWKVDTDPIQEAVVRAVVSVFNALKDPKYQWLGYEPDTIKVKDLKAAIVSIYAGAMKTIYDYSGITKISDVYENDPVMKALEGYGDEQLLSFDNAMAIIAAAHGDVYVKVDSAVKPTVDPFVLREGTMAIFAGMADGKVAEVANIKFEHSISNSGKPIIVVKDIATSGPDGVADLAIRQAIGNLAEDKYADGIAFTDVAFATYKREIISAVKDAGLKYQMFKGPDSLLIEIRDRAGRQLTNLENIRKLTGKSEYAKIADYYEMYTKYHTPADLLKDLGRDGVASLGASIAMYLWNEFIADDENSWADAKHYMLISMLGLVGTTGARAAGGHYTVPKISHYINTPIGVLDPSKIDVSARTSDASSLRILSNYKLSLAEKLGNVVASIISRSVRHNIPLLTAATKELKRVLRSADKIGYAYRSMAIAITRGNVQFDTDGVTVRTADGKVLPLLGFADDGETIIISKGNASAADIAARLPLYRKFFAEDADVNRALNAIEQLSDLIKPIADDLAQYELIDRSRADINKYKGVYLPRGRVYDVDEQGNYIVDDIVGSGISFMSRTSAEKHAILEAQSVIAEYSSGRYVDPITAIQMFATESSRRISEIMFGEILVRLNMQFHFAKTADEIVGDLREFRDSVAEQLFSLERKIRKSFKDIERENRLERQLRKKLERLSGRYEQLAAKLSDEKISREEKIKELRTTISETKKEFRSHIAEMKNRAMERGESEAKIAEISKLEREVEREMNAHARRIASIGVSDDMKEAVAALTKPRANPEAYQRAIALVDNVVRNLDRDIGALPAEMQALAKSVKEKLEAAKQVAVEERVHESTARGVEAKIQKAVLYHKKRSHLRVEHAGVKETVSDFADVRRQILQQIKAEIAEMRSKAVESMAKSTVGKASEIGKRKKDAYSRYQYIKNFETRMNEVIDRLEKLETKQPGKLRGVPVEKISSEIKRIEAEEMRAVYGNFLSTVDKYITKADELDRSKTELVSLSEYRNARKQAVRSLLEDVFDDKATIEHAERLLGRTLESSTIARLEVRIRELERAINNAKKRLEKGEGIKAEREKFIKEIEQQVKELREKKHQIDSIYKQRLYAALNPKPRVNIPGANTLTFLKEYKHYATAINKELSIRGLGTMENIVLAIQALNNLGRSVMATGDASFVGVTGLLASYNMPKSVVIGLKEAIATVANRTGFDNYVRNYDDASANMNTPKVIDWVRVGLHIAENDIPGVELAEFRYGEKGVLLKASEAINRIPIVKQSNALYTVTGNVTRLELARNLYSMKTHDGMSSEQRLAVMRGIAEEVNKVTGYTETVFGGVGMGTEVLSQMAFFAPRWMSSQFALAADALSKRDVRGAIAREFLMRMIGIGALMTIVANDMLGQETEFDPRDSNFMRIRLGDYDISLFGPWDSLVRGLIISAQGLPGVPGQGSPEYFIRSKFSPVVGTAADILGGETLVGEDLDAMYWLRKVMPFSMANMVEFAQRATDAEKEDRRDTIINGVVALMAAAFGVKATPLSRSERYQRLLEESNIDPNDPLAVRKWKEEHMDMLLSADIVQMTEYMTLKAEYNEKILNLEAKFKSGEISTLGEFIDLVSRENARHAGRIEQLMLGKSFKEVPDNKLSKYQLWLKKGFDLYDEAINPETGAFDQRKYNKLVDDYIDKYGEEAWDYFKEYTLLGDTPFMRERNEAIKKLSRLTIDGHKINYFDLPKVNPDVLRGKNSWPAGYGRMDDLEYQDLLQSIVDYVENERATGEMLRKQGKGYKVDQRQEFRSSIIFLQQDIIENVLPNPEMWNDDIFADLMSFRRKENKNPLIDKIREMYPYETRFFDKDITYQQLLNLKLLTGSK